jgi:hypothetical protein
MLSGMAADVKAECERTAAIETVIAELRRRGVAEEQIQNVLKRRSASSVVHSLNRS